MRNKDLIKLSSNGKIRNGIVWILLIVLFSACSPTIHYLGDTYKETTTIDVYYDEKDVDKAYRTIGKMTHDKYFNYEVDMIKQKMIESAKKKGGDGIIFLETSVSRENEIEGDRLLITAKIIKYKDG